jgi:hypothetical protein
MKKAQDGVHHPSLIQHYRPISHYMKASTYLVVPRMETNEGDIDGKDKGREGSDRAAFSFPIALPSSKVSEVLRRWKSRRLTLR